MATEVLVAKIREHARTENVRLTRHAQEEMVRATSAKVGRTRHERISGRKWMKCTIAGCPGAYEERRVVHTVRHQGRVKVIDQVPAEVCSICGDVLLSPETVRHIETILKRQGSPDRPGPPYQYAQTGRRTSTLLA